MTGAVYGNTTTSGNSLSGSGTGFNFVNRTSSNGTYPGTFAQRSTISFSASDGMAFNGTYDTTYDQTPTVANVAGTYTGWAFTGGTTTQTTTVVVDVNCNNSSSFVSGNLMCVTSGKATPRASGKNVYNLQLTFTGNFCALGNGTVVNGVASYGSTSRQLIAMGLNSAKSDGLIFVGVR